MTTLLLLTTKLPIIRDLWFTQDDVNPTLRALSHPVRGEMSVEKYLREEHSVP